LDEEESTVSHTEYISQPERMREEKGMASGFVTQPKDTLNV
jgi:hypothetical protein